MTLFAPCADVPGSDGSEWALEHIHNQAPLHALSSASPQLYFVELLDLGVRAA